ncbi:MAG: TIGR04283 family arsenosugar biosynthesis glycosyltransferase [Saprospiraceae bacterium]
MTLDIIIPALNEQENLKKLLPLLASHLYKEQIKVIVIDAATSDDDTRQKCEQYGAQYIKSSHTQRGKQMNEGAISGTSDVLLFLHADVIPPNDFYIKIQTAIKNKYQMGLFSFKFDSSHWLLKINSYFTKIDGFFTGGGDQSHFMTRAIFQQMGGYNDDQVIMEDFEFFHRIRRAKVSYTIIDSPFFVSARKFENNSYLRMNLINFVTFLMYKSGVHSHTLKAFYCKWVD